MSGERVLNLTWAPPGPVAEQFMKFRGKRVHVLNGPVGSGKTTAVLIKAVRLAMEQRVSPRQQMLIRGRATPSPARMFKLTVVRDTYRQLWRSTLPSWWKRVPKEVGDWSGAEGGPGVHRVPFGLADGTVVDFVADFVAIGDNDIEEFMRGYEPTWWYLNEGDLFLPEVYQWARSRWGRYPDIADGGPSSFGVLIDCNAPTLGTWMHDMMLRQPDDVEWFRQPSGFDPAAENKANLPEGYYEEMSAGWPEAMIDRMIRNKPGFTMAGKPVHGDFDDGRHVSDRVLEAIPGLPLYMGFDAGLDPACAIGQKLGNGQWRIIDEVVSEHGTGALRFAGNVNQLLSERYRDWQMRPLEPQTWPAGWNNAAARNRGKIRGWADPSAAYGADKQDEADQTWIDLVSYHTGVRIEPCATNDTTTRREGLRRVLTLSIDRQPAFLLSPRCEKLRAGLSGGFRYRKMQLGGAAERFTDEVEKNAFSHPCEALEYLMLGGGEGAEIHERRQRGWDVRNLPRGEDPRWSPI